MNGQSELPGSAPDLTVRLGPLTLAHPVINASGTMEIFELAEAFGGEILEAPPVAVYVPKTITLVARSGNLPPRIIETPSGMINAIGLSGEGMESFVSESLHKLLRLPCPLILSVGGFSVEEYVGLARGLREALEEQVGQGWRDRVGLELNVSCPNVHSGCLSIGANPRETELVVGSVRRGWPGLLIAKLTPNVTDIAIVASAAEAAGADAVAAVNTYKAMAIDRTTLRPYLGNGGGGLSGPAIKPLALRSVYEICARVQIPVIGIGGVACVQDVLDFLACGARVVAVGSAGLRDPLLAGELAAQLGQELGNRNMGLDSVIGIAHRGQH